MEMYRDKFASRQQNILHSSFHMVWVVGRFSLPVLNSVELLEKDNWKVHTRLFYVGFFWYECKEVWIEGLRSYFLDWWNCLDVVVLSMYLASFTLRVVIMLKGYFLCQDQSSNEDCIYFTQTCEKTKSKLFDEVRSYSCSAALHLFYVKVRDQWHQEDPQLISEVLFAVTSMLSFTRLAYILPAQESLGTLQISIGKMIDDMMR